MHIASMPAIENVFKSHYPPGFACFHTILVPYMPLLTLSVSSASRFAYAFWIKAKVIFEMAKAVMNTPKGPIQQYTAPTAFTPQEM